MSCNICFKNKNLIKCESCFEFNCKFCISKYINTHKTECCPNCKCRWSDYFIKTNFSFNFLKKFLNKLNQFSFEEHYSRRSESLDIVCNIKKLSIQKRELRKEIEKIKINNVLYITPYLYIKRHDILTIEERKDIFINHINQMEKLVVLENKLEYINAIDPKYTMEKGNYIKICPNLKCNGFLDENLFCGLCDLFICSNCHIEKKKNHACKNEDIETKTFFEKSGVSCPNCNVLILKIDGCNHMWCRKCKNSFDWRTGYIIRGRVSNPDRFRYQNETQKNFNSDCPKIRYLNDFIEHSVLVDFYNNFDYEIEDIRINFLLGYINLEYYKKLFILNYKRFYIVELILNLMNDCLKDPQLDFLKKYKILYSTITFNWTDIPTPNSIEELNIFIF